MLSPDEWENSFLLVSALANGVGVAAQALLDHVSQEEFFEYLLTQTNRIPYVVHVTQLTEEAFDILYPLYKKNGIVLGE